jgi:hypothetical protein
MELNNVGSHVCIETVYHKNLVLRGNSFTLVTKLNSINLFCLGAHHSVVTFSVLAISAPYIKSIFHTCHLSSSSVIYLDLTFTLW